MQHVLIVVRSLKIGGIERVAVNLANALVEQGHNVHLLLYKNVLELETDPRVTIHVRDFDKLNRLTVIGLVYDLITRALLRPLLPYSGFLWKGIYYTPLFQHFVRKLEKRGGFHFDQIIFRGQGAFDVLWPLKEPRAYYVVESYPWLHNRGDSRFKQKVDRFYLRRLFHGKRVITVSTGIKEALAEKCKAADAEPALLQTIFNPCPIAEVRQLANAPAPVPTEPYLVHVGRLTPVKNQELLLRAFAKSGIAAKLVILGKGKSEQKLRQQAKALGLAEQVIFQGHSLNPFPWMKHARLFVLSSRSEGLGMVLIESLACGTPVIATDCPGGIRDIMIEELTNYIAALDEDDLARIMRAAWNDPLQIKAHWVERFDAQYIANQFLDLGRSGH